MEEQIFTGPNSVYSVINEQELNTQYTEVDLINPIYYFFFQKSD